MTRGWVGVAVAVALAGCPDRKQKSERRKPRDDAAPVIDAAIPLERTRAVIERVEVKVLDPSNGPAREVYPRLLAQRLGATLTRSPWFLGATDPVPEGMVAHRGVVELVVGYDQLSEGSTGTPTLIAAVEATLAWSDHQPRVTPSANVLAERPYGPDEADNLAGLTATHVEQAVAEVAATLIEKERIRVGPAAAATEALDSDQPDTRIWALGVIGERKLGGAFDAVVKRLEAEAETERDAAIGALIALGDRRAVQPLARLAEFRDYALIRRVIEAIASLGGQEAGEYLEFVATGHPDDDIRQQAREALERARRNGRVP